MADSRNLHRQAAELRRRAKSKLAEAEKANDKASNYVKIGEYSRAAYENVNAARFSNEAAQLERDALDRENQASNLEQKISEIDKKEEQIKAECKTQIDSLEYQKRTLSGY